MGSFFRFGILARAAAVGAVSLAVANCSNSHISGKIDPRYGVAASPRVIEPGQPVPKGGGVYRVGKPYAVGGRFYVPEENINYSAVGLASWYGQDFHGRYTANGEIFDMNSISAAHPTLPLPSYVRVTNLANRRSIVVRVNDRGPYVGDRLIDVSVRTAQLLGFQGHGVARVKVEYIGRAPLQGSDDRKLAATLRQGAPGEAGVQLASSTSFAAHYRDRSLSHALPSSGIPTPPDRPYRLGETARDPTIGEAPTMELAAATRPRVSAVGAAAQPLTTPVSAYATRYPPAAGFMTGRGLY
ncbi:MAG TPA: septal ring lytic transglycosylase RlpA family protein [Pseudolabrys sp.]|nr:septal ring lytic transglycosylase RlpA family protein [Pseudolabrys sp.]